MARDARSAFTNGPNPPCRGGRGALRGTRPVRRRADSTRSWQHCPSRSRPTRAARTGCVRSWRCCARPHHNTLQIDGFHNRPRAGVIAVIAQRHLEAKPVEPKRLGRVDVVEEIPDRHAEPPVAKIAPDAMGRRVRRTCGVDAGFALHRAEELSVEEMEKVTYNAATSGNARAHEDERDGSG